MFLDPPPIEAPSCPQSMFGIKLAAKEGAAAPLNKSIFFERGERVSGSAMMPSPPRGGAQSAERARNDHYRPTRYLRPPR